MTYFIQNHGGEFQQVNSVLHVCTSNDANGHPRRLIVCLGNYGHVVALFEEGFDWGGIHKLDKAFSSWTKQHCVRINVTISELNRWKSMKLEEPCKVITQAELPELPAFA
jgi:hypothetical protein